jgi:putative transposase
MKKTLKLHKSKNPHSKYQRYNILGHAHELTFSCYKRQPFLINDKPKEFLVTAINKAREKHQFDLWAYVFMPEHIHLFIFPRSEEYSISDILKSIKQSVSRKVVNLLKESDPGTLRYLETRLRQPRYRFWQDGGGYDRNYWSTDNIRSQIEYIHYNPVRRGFVVNPEEWFWSSAGDWLAGRDGPIVINRDSFPVG